MTPLEILKFEHGKFYLSEVSTPKLRLKLAKNAYWKSGNDDTYYTGDLGAAVKFRYAGDTNAEKIFRRAFQSHYTLPKKLPALPGLDPHQRAGLLWILERKRSYLAHAPGAGKTATAILASCVCAGEGQTVYIVPPALSYNWESEIYKFTEWLGIFPTIGVVRTSAEKDRVAWKADFIIVPDSMLTKPWVYTRLLKMKKKFLAVDEASRFKESSADRSIALYGGYMEEKRFPGLFQTARHVVFLDGSPMPNRPLELWAPTYALHPEAIDCKGYDDFGYRYCGAKPNAYGQWEYLYSSNEKELKEKLRKDFMHVVTEDELSHPERRRSILLMNQDARSPEHRTWESKGINFRPDEKFCNGEIARFRKELGIRKVPWVARYIRERVKEKNESILVFAWHREVCEQLAKQIATSYFDVPGIIYGGVSPTLREKFFRDFQSGKDKVLILNIAAGGRGHNLQRADRVIFAEYSWTDETNKQCEKRASRRGSDKDFVRCEYIVSPNSMDEIVLKSVFAKQKRVRKVIG